MDTVAQSAMDGQIGIAVTQGLQGTGTIVADAGGDKTLTAG